VGVIDAPDGEATKLQIERLLDDPKTGPRALLGVLRASRLPEQSPPVRIPVREQTEARNATEEPSVAPEAAPIVVAPPLRRPLLERIPPFVTGQVAGAVTMGLATHLLNGAYFINLDWVVLMSMGPVVSALVCWRWPGPDAPAWKLLPVALLANPMMLMLIAVALGWPTSVPGSRSSSWCRVSCRFWRALPGACSRIATRREALPDVSSRYRSLGLWSEMRPQFPFRVTALSQTRTSRRRSFVGAICPSQ